MGYRYARSKPRFGAVQSRRSSIRVGRALALVLLALPFWTACGQGEGAVQVFVEPEDTIPDGLAPGTGMENVHDGWSVTYQKFLVVVGNFRAARSSGGASLAQPTAYVVDLMSVPAGGLVIARFDDVDAVRFDQVGFDLPNASASAVRAENTSEADYNVMLSNGFSLYFEATLSKPDGQSCSPTAPGDCVARPSLTVKWGLRAGTAFDGCAPEEGAAGFAVPSGGTVQVKPTIHGDHWFFTNLTMEEEITERRAQWIVNSDLDRNGETTLDELRAVRAANVFPSPPYNLSGTNFSGTVIPVDTAYNYLEVQARTLGDYQGDGECPLRRILP